MKSLQSIPLLQPSLPVVNHCPQQRWPGFLKISFTAQKLKFSIKGFFSKCDQISCLLRICSLTEEILMQNFIFCVCSVWIWLSPFPIFLGTENHVVLNSSNVGSWQACLMVSSRGEEIEYCVSNGVHQSFATVWKVSVFGVFLVRILSHSDWIRKDARYLSVFSPNAGKYEPERLQIQTLHVVCVAISMKDPSKDSWCTVKSLQVYLFLGSDHSMRS